MIDLRVFVRALLLIGLVLGSRVAQAQPEPPTLVLEVLLGAAEFDAAALRQGVAAELAMRVVAPGEEGARAAEGTFAVGVDREKSEVFVEFRRRGASSLTRRFPLPIDRSKLQQTVVFLAGNMARDESREVLRDLGPDAVVPAPAAATSEVHPSEQPLAPRPEPTRKRFWIGIDAEAAIGVVPGGSDVCGQDSTATSGFSCVNGIGQSLQRGTIRTGLGFASSRFAVSFGYALHDNWLVGGRFGFAVDRYPGNAAGLQGRTWGPTHLELRATYVVGERALVQPGARLAVTAGAGVAEWDTKMAVAVTAGNPPSPLLVDAWRVQAGVFLSGAVGPRILLGERTVIVVNAVKFTALAGAISRTGATLLFTPEVGGEVAF